tara:strand:+ start:217 stop:747 length:531 start_codon:yes stop_codon:yes gene_type:complete
MICPRCSIDLERAMVAGTAIDYCPRCYGMWFEKGELQEAKDAKDRELRWLDTDLWKDPASFRAKAGGRVCPKDRLNLYEIEYGDSGVNVDICGMCHGIWLDRGEFKNIVGHLKEKAEYQILYRYLENLKEELWEVFSGPEVLKEELLDVLAVLKMLRYKFAIHYPSLAKLMRVVVK